MGNVINVDFKLKRLQGQSDDIHQSSNSLKEARKLLGGGYFRKALFDWSLTELRRVANHPDAFFSGASDSYNAILQFRIQRKMERTDLKLIKAS